MVDINLLPRDVRAVEKKAKLARVLKLVGVGSVLFSVITSVILLALFLNTRQAASKAVTRVAAIEKELTASQSKIDSAVVLNAKLSELQKILNSGPRYSVLLRALSQKVPADINIKELTVTSSTKVNLAGDSPSYLALSQFLQVLTSDATSIFSGETLQSVVLDNQTGRVQFVLLVTLKDQSLIV